MNSWKDFLCKINANNSSYLNSIARYLIEQSDIKEGDCVLDAGAGLGLITLNILKNFENVKVIAVDNDTSCLEELEKIVKNSNKLTVLNNDLANIELQNYSVDKIISRSSLMHCKCKLDVLKEYHRILKDKTQITMCEAVFYDKLDRYHKYLSHKIPKYKFYKKVEEQVRNDIDDPLTNYDIKSIKKDLKKAGFKNINIIQILSDEEIKIKSSLTEANIFYEGKPHSVPLKEKFLKYMSNEEFDEYYQILEQSMLNKRVWHYVILMYIFAQKEPCFKDYLILKINSFLIKMFVIPRNIKRLLNRIL